MTGIEFAGVFSLEYSLLVVDQISRIMLKWYAAFKDVQLLRWLFSNNVETLKSKMQAWNKMKNFYCHRDQLINRQRSGTITFIM